jgi:hypothetical protein
MLVILRSKTYYSVCDLRFSRRYQYYRLLGCGAVQSGRILEDHNIDIVTCTQ